MKIVTFSEAESYEPEKGWKRLSLCSESDVSVEYFTKPPGHASPLHHHPSSQVLVVLEGKLAVFTERDGERELEKGDAVYFHGGEAHVVKNPLDRPAAGIDIFAPGRSFDFWLRRDKDR